MKHQVQKAAQFSIKENVKQVLRDKDGNIKPLFSENFLGRAILKTARHFIKNPIDVTTGQVKAGLHNFIAAYGIRLQWLTGTWGDFRLIQNGMTNAGFAGVASRLNGAGSVPAFDYIGVGIGTTAFNAADTTLESEIVDSGLARVQGTASRVTTTQTNDTAQATTTFSVSGTKAVTESGLLSAVSSGVLLCRQTFSAVNVVSGDSLQITWKVKAAAA